MKLSFWQWLGIFLLVSLVMSWLFWIINGKALINAQKEIDLSTPPKQTLFDQVSADPAEYLKTH